MVLEKAIRNLAKAYLKLPYKTWLIKDDRGLGWTAGIVEWEGCLSDGDTIEEAMKSLKGIMLAWCECLIERGQEVPMPDIMK